MTKIDQSIMDILDVSFENPNDRARIAISQHPHGSVWAFEGFFSDLWREPFFNSRNFPFSFFLSFLSSFSFFYSSLSPFNMFPTLLTYFPILYSIFWELALSSPTPSPVSPFLTKHFLDTYPLMMASLGLPFSFIKPHVVSNSNLFHASFFFLVDLP